MYSNFQTVQQQAKKRPKSTKIRLNGRFKNSNSQSTIQQHTYGQGGMKVMTQPDQYTEYGKAS